jgi:ABC-type transporter Mla subunit MlaD
MKFDMNAVVQKLGRLEGTLKKKIESGAIVKEARRYADAQVKTLRQKVKSSKDAQKVLDFIEKRQKEIEKLAADLPREVKNVRGYIETQRKELEKIGNDLVKKAREGKLDADSIRSAIRTATTKKAAPKRRAATTKKSAGTKKKASGTAKKASGTTKKAAGTRKKATTAKA